jgi:glucosamine--fructose-6-phosphate aminotransferase (isomerizing)
MSFQVLPMSTLSLFESEANEAPSLAVKQFARLSAALPPLIDRLDRAAPRMAATVARGSSDHAADYAGYLFGLRLGLATASIAPSLSSVYGRALRLDGAFVLAISQSGESPDLVAATESARAGGALTLALVNQAASPLAQAADAAIEIGAGAERAVAATKSFLLSLTAVFHLVAAWTRDRELLEALEALPAVLDRCAALRWSGADELFAAGGDCFVVGRGPSLPVAREIALKLKEVCGIHAEALSAAELLHGPIAIASPGFPAIVLGGEDAARPTVGAAIERLRAARAPVLHVSARVEDALEGVMAVRIPPAPHPLLQPVVAAQAAYPFLAALARKLGRAPDRPPGLEKITRTV